MRPVKTVMRDDKLRVLTKTSNNQRRVSCSCCQTECCMYPAAQLGVGYGSDDLPDSVLAPINADEFGIYTRDGSRFVGTFTGDDGSIGLEVIVATSSFGATGWTLRAEGGTVTEGTFPCLFGQDELQTQDNFADTYTVERRTETLTGPPEATFTITRESLCRWCGFDPLLESTICLEYNPPTFAGQGHWSIEGFGEAPPRNNSSPVGNYNDGGSIWMVLEP
jgi:uncharacterized protein CbrC (UPF0167 family)